MVITPEQAKKGETPKPILNGIARVFESDLDALLAKGRGKCDFYSLNYYRSMPSCPEQTARELLETYQKVGWKVTYHPSVQGGHKRHSDTLNFEFV